MKFGKTLTPGKTRCRSNDYGFPDRAKSNAIQVPKSTVHDMRKYVMDRVKMEKSKTATGGYGNISATDNLLADALNGFYITAISTSLSNEPSNALNNAPSITTSKCTKQYSEYYTLNFYTTIQSAQTIHPPIFYTRLYYTSAYILYTPILYTRL